MPDRAHAEPTPDREIRLLLEVYTMPHCPGWHCATSLATQVHAAGLTGVEIRLVDLSRPGVVVPETVVASPTWLLDGRRISLGNPDPDWLLARLAALVRDKRS
ncbi:MAG: hypothetical protein ACRDJC_00625 [Thermomicrobiales bacterium]